MMERVTPKFIVVDFAAKHYLRFMTLIDSVLLKICPAGVTILTLSNAMLCHRSKYAHYAGITPEEENRVLHSKTVPIADLPQHMY